MYIRLSLLLGSIPRQSSSGTANSALHPLTDAMTQVAQLTFRFLLVAALTPLASTLHKAFVADQSTGGLVHTADGLVIPALRAFGAVLGDTALGAYGVRANPGSGL